MTDHCLVIAIYELVILAPRTCLVSCFIGVLKTLKNFLEKKLFVYL